VSTSRSDELDVLGDSDCLTFVEYAEPIALFDPEVLDRVLRFVPALDVRTFVHDQGAEVPRVEHDDVGGFGGHIEHHEGLTRMRRPPKLI
jgi:hypothetical protein